MQCMHGFYPEHPIPRSVTLEQCIAYYDTIPVDYIFNLVYPIRDDETEAVNRFNFELTSVIRGSSHSAASTSATPTRQRSSSAVSGSTASSASSSTRSSRPSIRSIRG